MDPIRFDHVAVAVLRLCDVTPFVVGELGGRPAYGAAGSAFRFWQWRFAGGGRLEVLEPMGDDGFLHRFLAQRGPGVHHVTFTVPSLREACRRAEAQGYAVVGFDDSDPRWAEAFLHPKQALGIVVQIVESKSGGGGAGGKRRWASPPAPEPPPAVTLLGLRTRARAQWRDLLGGEVAEGAGGQLTCRWPGSPLRLSVEIDPAADEGPVAIEIASDRPLALPDGPHPVLGAVFALQT
jgi:methylmalonyl-CoA/ethylmalonyl-CoA epimerase